MIPNLSVCFYVLSLSCMLKVNPPNLPVVMQPPQLPPPVCPQLPRPSRNQAQSLKRKPLKTQARPFWTHLYPLATATLACRTMPVFQVCPVHSSMVPLSSCPQHQQSSTHWDRLASTSTRPAMASTLMPQVSLHYEGLTASRCLIVYSVADPV